MTHFHYEVQSRLAGIEVVEAQTTNRTAADTLVKGLKNLRGGNWEFRIVTLSGRGKPTNWG